MKSGSGNVTKGTSYILVQSCPTTGQLNYGANDSIIEKGYFLVEYKTQAKVYPSYEDAVIENNLNFSGLMTIVRYDWSEKFWRENRLVPKFYRSQPSKRSKHKFVAVAS